MSMQLDEEVRLALEGRRGEWPLISEQSGVSHSWISQYCRRKIPNPGFRTLRRLADLLIDPAASAVSGSSVADALSVVNPGSSDEPADAEVQTSRAAA